MGPLLLLLMMMVMMMVMMVMMMMMMMMMMMIFSYLICWKKNTLCTHRKALFGWCCCSLTPTGRNLLSSHQKYQPEITWVCYTTEVKHTPWKMMVRRLKVTQGELLNFRWVMVWKSETFIPTMVIYHMGVSKNNGTPKSSNLIGFSIINHPFWGSRIFGHTHIKQQTSSKNPNLKSWRGQLLVDIFHQIIWSCCGRYTATSDPLNEVISNYFRKK